MDAVKDAEKELKRIKGDAAASVRSASEGARAHIVEMVARDRAYVDEAAGRIRHEHGAHGAHGDHGHGGHGHGHEVKPGVGAAAGAALGLAGKAASKAADKPFAWLEKWADKHAPGWVKKAAYAVFGGEKPSGGGGGGHKKKDHGHGGGHGHDDHGHGGGHH